MDLVRFTREAFDACARGHLEALERCFEQMPHPPPHPDEITHLGSETLLEWTARHGHFDIVRYLVEERGANVQPNDDEGPLICACAFGHVEVVRYLLQCGANPSRCCDFKDSAFDVALWYNRVDVVKCIMEETSGAACDGEDALDFDESWEIGQNTFLIVEYLVNEWNFDISRGQWRLAVGVLCRAPLNVIRDFVDKLHLDVGTSMYDTPAFALVADRDRGGLCVLKYLVHECRVNAHDKSLMRKVCDRGRFDMFQFLVNDCGVRPAPHLKCDLLHQSGDLRITRMLVEGFHFDPNGRDVVNNTPLVSRRRDLEHVKYLVEQCKADVNLQNMHGQTALMMAVQEPTLDWPLVRYLVVNCRADVNIRNKCGRMAFELIEDDLWGRSDGAEAVDKCRFFIECARSPSFYQVPRPWQGA